MPLKVAGWMLPDSDFSKLDPALIEDAEQSNLVRSIFSSLMGFGKNGNLEASLAESFSVDGSEIHFSLRKGVPTGIGRDLDARDVLFSFKRLILLDKNTHGKLRFFLQNTDQLKDINSDFPGLELNSSNQIVFRLKSRNLVKFFLPLLANPDFAIIPRESLDLSRPELPIIRHDISSGPYLVSKITSDGKLFLQKKHGHYLTKSSSPETIEYIPTKSSELLASYKNGNIDLIPTYHAYQNKDLENFYTPSRDNLHKTLNINLVFSSFTKKGISRLNKTSRAALGEKIKSAAIMHLKESFDLTPTREFFSSVGESSLGDQLPSIKGNIQTAISDFSAEGIIFDSYVISGPQKKLIVETIPELQLPKAESDQPDVYLSFTDAGFFDNLSLLSYTQSCGYFGLSDKEFYSQLNSLVEIEDPSLRTQELRKLHIRLIDQAIAIPIATSPFLALIRKPWSMDFYNMFAGTPLWMIRKQ